MVVSRREKKYQKKVEKHKGGGRNFFFFLMESVLREGLTKNMTFEKRLEDYKGKSDGDI